MRTPDFFIVGAAKSGTSSLFEYLIDHPSIFIPAIKEPHYFSDYYHTGAPKFASVDDYLQVFSECSDHQKAGDLSTSYLYSPSAARRIRELQPEAKIFMVLRNPVDRAYSLYWYNRNQFVESLSFEEALDQEPQRIATGWRVGQRTSPLGSKAVPYASGAVGSSRFHYVESGKYFAQVKRYLEEFGSESVKVYLFDDLVRDPAALCRDIFASIGVASDHSVRTDRVYNRSGVHKSTLIGRAVMWQFPGRALVRSLAPNSARRFKHRVIEANAQRPPAMDPSTRARLTEAFREDVEQLALLLNRDLDHWLTARGTIRTAAQR